MAIRQGEGIPALSRGTLAASLPLAATALPVGVGLGLTVALAFGLSSTDLSPGTRVWSALLSDRAVWQSAALTLWTAWGSTVLAFGMALCLGFWIQYSRIGRWLQLALPALLAVPHAAFAIGFYFLISPSGWMTRLISPGLTGWNRPPDFATVQDPLGLALLAGLAIKETPFLLLTLLSALGQSQFRQNEWLGRSLGYSRWRCWVTLTVPQLYRQMRLPLVVVLAYGLSVVDMARVLGPAIPGTLAVRSTQWLYDPDPGSWPLGAAAALLLVGLALFSIGVWRGLEHFGKPLLKKNWLSGKRNAKFSATVARWWVPLFWSGTLSGSLLAIVIWSFTWRWRFPDAFPASLSLEFWLRNADQIMQPAWNTLSLGVTSTLLGLIAALLLLESGKPLKKMQLSLLYLPLLLPQLAFLFGIQLLLLYLQADGRWWSVVWAHALFVFPYITLTLHGPWQAYDQRYSQVSRALGKNGWHTWWFIKRPILLRPLCYAAALGFSVSVAQYLSTLFVGAGRFPTLTTEAIALAAGGDRRALAAVAFVQMALPMFAFALAFAIPKLRFRNRQALRDAS